MTAAKVRGMSQERLRWHIVTGEYPPQPGGVSDYTRQLARALAAAGDAVTVWAPATDQPAPVDPGVQVHQLPGRFGLKALWHLHYALRRKPKPFRLLIQYVPQSYGYKGANLFFSLWLWSVRDLRPWIMFHEVAVSPSWQQRWSSNVLAFITNVMAGIAAAAAYRCFISIPRWTDKLRRVGLRSPRPEWLPVYSNVAVLPDLQAREMIRKRLVSNSASIVVGHFGTFGMTVGDLVSPVFALLLERRTDLLLLLIGRNSDRYAARFCQEHPGLSKQVKAVADLSGTEVAAYILACDLLLQMYDDGVSSRRGSLLAGVALGMPIVANEGNSTEPLWGQQKLVALTRGVREDMVAAVERLTDQPEERKSLGSRAKAGYQRFFSIEQTIRVLRESPTFGRQ